MTAPRKTSNKTMPTKIDPADYVAAVENDRRRADAEILLGLFARITGAEPKMWGPSIIGYGAYQYKYESGREGDSLIVGFSPRKANMVLYTMGSIAEDDPLRDRLGKHRCGKGCLYINRLDDVDLQVLEKIIVKSWKATIKRWGRLDD